MSILDDFHIEGYAIGPKPVFDETLRTVIIDRASAMRKSWEGSDWLPLMQPHRQNALFLTTLRTPEIVNTVELLLCSEAVGLQTTFYYNGPDHPGFPAHQDSFFVKPSKNSFVSVWIPLVNVNSFNGGLLVWRGSHTRGCVEHTVSPEGIAYIPMLSIGGKSLNVEAGTPVYLHQDLIHKGQLNRSQSRRFVLLQTYLRKGAEFRAGETAMRAPVELR